MVADALPNRNVESNGLAHAASPHKTAPARGFPYTGSQIFCQDLPKLAEI